MWSHTPPQSQQIYIMDRPVFFNFSTSQEITRCVCEVVYTYCDAGMCICRSPYGIVPGTSAGMDPTGTMPMAPEGSNSILLFTVFNPMYPITVVSEGRLAKYVASLHNMIVAGGIDFYSSNLLATSC